MDSRSMLEDDTTLFAALRAGARGYLLKGAGHEDVRRALEGVVQGDMVVARGVADQLRQGIGVPGSASAFPQLTSRELEVLGLVGRGRTNEQIAATLFLSVKTVRNNVSVILTKLGAASRAEAVALARDADPTP